MDPVRRPARLVRRSPIETIAPAPNGAPGPRTGTRAVVRSKGFVMDTFRRPIGFAFASLAGIGFIAAAALAADVQRAPAPAPTGSAARSVPPAIPPDARDGSAVLGPLPRAAVSAAPSVRQIQPETVNAGETRVLTLLGAGFGPRTRVSFGAGVEVLDAPQVQEGHQMRVRVRVAADAAPGPRIPRLTDGASTGSGPARLTVLAAPARPVARSVPPERDAGVSRPPLRADTTIRTAPVTGMPPPPRPADPATRTAPLPDLPERSAAASGWTRSTPSPMGSLPPPSALSRTRNTPAQPAGSAPVELAFGKLVLDSHKFAWSGKERTFDRSTTITPLVWKAANPGAYQWRWQIASQPFPDDVLAQPPALLDEGNAVYDQFKLDLLPYVPAAPIAPPAKKPAKASDKGANQALPLSAQQSPSAVFDPQPAQSALPARYYIRIVAFGDGKPAGIRSNSVVATYQPGANDEFNDALGKTLGEAQIAKAAASQAKDLFALKIVGYELAVFPDPNRAGCVKLIKNPHFHKAFHPLQFYAPGEHCPKPDPKTQEKGWFDKWVIGSIKGWAFAWNKLAGFYNGAKSWVASQIAGGLPCEWLGGKLQDECEAAAQTMVESAISAGMVAAGMPPSMPDLDALAELGKGKVADAAVEGSCEIIESNGGTCSPETKEKLATWYEQGLDQLQKQVASTMKYEGREPGCANAPDGGEIAAHGLLPLPCFSDYPGVVVVPAKGAVYAPPTVKVRVTRKAPQPAHVKGCDRVSVGMSLENTFEGGWLSGKKLPPAPVAGQAYIPASDAVPPLGVGKSTDIVLVLAKMAVVEVPGNHYGTFYLPNWLELYRGGKGSLWASMAPAIIATGTSHMKEVSGPCTAGDSIALQIPE